MKKLLLIAFLFISFRSISQTPQETQQANRIENLEIQLEDLHKRTHQFANLNNAAGMLYFGGLIIAAASVNSDNPDKELYWIAGGMALTGTVILYFSGNKLKFGGSREWKYSKYMEHKELQIEHPYKVGNRR